MLKINYIIVDDDAFIRYGLKNLFAKEKGFVFRGEAKNGEQAVKLVLEIKPDIVIMDISMPKMDGIEATRQIIKTAPRTKVVCLTMKETNNIIKEALQAGATAYIHKTCPTQELLKGIHSALQGQVYLCPATSATLVTSIKGDATQQEKIVAKKLTPKEHAVLQLLAEGYSTRSIASTQGVSMKTISTHRENLMEKLGIYSIAGLTKYAIREGMTTIVH